MYKKKYVVKVSIYNYLDTVSVLLILYPKRSLATNDVFLQSITLISKNVFIFFCDCGVRRSRTIIILHPEIAFFRPVTCD